MRAWFDTEVAKEIGLNEAILLNYFTYWTLANQKNGKFIVDGIAYVKVTYPELEKIFCHWGVCTIKRAIYSLQSSGYIEIHHFGSGIDKTNWYRATDKAVELLHMDSVLNESTSYQSDTSIVSNRHHPSYQNDTSIVSKTQNLQSNKKETKERVKKDTRAHVRAKASEVFANPSPELTEAWDAFVDMRCQMREPFTAYAVRQNVANLERLSQGDQAKMAAILNQSVANGWKGVFPLPEDKARARQRQSRPQQPSAEDIYDEVQDILNNGG